MCQQFLGGIIIRHDTRQLSNLILFFRCVQLLRLFLSSLILKKIVELTDE